MRLPGWLQPPRHILVLFAGVTLAPAIVLSWLGWRLIEQDRAFDRARIQQSLDEAGQHITAGLLSELRATASALPQWISDASAAPFNDDAVLVRFGAQEIRARHGAPLVFVPVVPPDTDASGASW